MSKTRMPSLTAKRLRGLHKILTSISSVPTHRDTDVLAAMEWLREFVEAKDKNRRDKLANRPCKKCRIRKMAYPFTLCEPCLEESNKNKTIAEQIGYVPE